LGTIVFLASAGGRPIGMVPDAMPSDGVVLSVPGEPAIGAICAGRPWQRANGRTVF